jgi:hypothetical protein
MLTVADQLKDMAKNNITQWSATSASNTDVGGIQIEGENVVANFDNALREIMKQIADLNTGASFIHDTYKIADSDAETKLAKFDAGSITDGQTRTFTFPDKDGTIALADDVLALSGGTLTGFVTLHAAPTSDLHAASKKYVDDNSATTADPVFTGDAQFENLSDGSTSVPAGYVVNGSAKAWARVTGTGTASLDDSLNISSLTDTGTGTYTLSFTSSFDTVNYSTSGAPGHSAFSSYILIFSNHAVSSVQFQTRYATSNSIQDLSANSTALMGELA